MSLVLPSEIIVDQFLPTMRVMLARRLADHDLTQQEIANHLGVTQAAVSTYISDNAPLTSTIANNPQAIETADHIAAGLANDEMDGYDALADLLDLIHTFEDRGPICELHEAAMPALQGLGCDLCIRGPNSELRTERDTLADVRSAARTLCTVPDIAAYIPNVGTNIGAALPDAETVTDVAAIPGRIYTMHGRIEIPANPEFGASQHVATALLAARTIDSTIRGAINIATTDQFLTAAKQAGYDPMEFDPEYDDREAHLRTRFSEIATVPLICYHEGAYGIEPITYVFGETATAAAERIVDIVTHAQSSTPSE